MGISALLAAFASLVIAAITASPAFADRTYDSQITGFGNPQGLAIDGGGDVWIDDYGSGGLISEYDAYPSQTLLGTQNGGGHHGGYILSIALNNADGHLYVADSGPVVVDVYESGLGSFTEEWKTKNSCGTDRVAVDNSSGPSNGRVYIARSCDGVTAFVGNHTEAPFSASGQPGKTYISGNELTGTPSGNFGGIQNVATDTQGNLYVVDQAKSVVDEFDESGTFVQEFTGAGAPTAFSSDLTGVAVDPTNGNVLIVDSGNQVVDEFSSSGEYLDQLTGPSEGENFTGLTGGIAVNSEGYVYVADAGKGAVDIFTPNVVIPKISNEAVTGITPTTATLSATVDPNEGGDVESCSFEYGPTTTYGSKVPCGPATPYDATTEASAKISGLSTETRYHYRTVVSNANGVKKGRDQTFIPHYVSQITTEGATGLAKTAATLNASFVGNGEDTHYYFEWGETEGYGHKTAIPPGEDAGSPAGPSPTQVHFDLLGLSAEITYHYRVVATNGLGSSVGEDVRFTTLGPAVEGLSTEAATMIKAGGAQLHGSFVGNNEDTDYYFEWGESESYGQKTAAPPGEDAGSPSGPSPTAEAATLTGLHSETAYHYRFVATNGIGTTYGGDQTFTTTGAVAELETEEPTELDGTTATFHGSFNAEPLDTHYYFSYSYYSCQWSESTPPELETCGSGPTLEAPVGGADAGIPSGPTKVSLPVTGLEPDAEYSVVIVASNSLGTSVGPAKSFKTPPAPPEFRKVATAEVHTDVATVAAEIYPGESNATNFNEPGAKYTEYYFEYGSNNCAISKCLSTPKTTMGRGTTFESVTGDLENLTPGTTYHWRVAAVNTNKLTPTFGPDETFTTFPFVELGHDPCPNAHQRQQTGAAGLLDCRAYERVSSPNAGGYDVESDLVPGETPFGGFSQAESPPRVLYGVHDGGISGTGHPTNDGVDPYVATRGANGWSTEYVGIPANIDPSSDPFSSTVAEATPNLETFAFSGEALCAPCFGSGIETGIPLHLPNGSLVQGMAGSIQPPISAKPDGHIAKYFSADGSHFIFGSVSQFEPDANKNGDVSIYDRDLSTGETHVVSKTPFGENLPCLQGSGSCHSPGDPNGIAELDISKDGSRIIVAQKVSEDADHNVYWHPYMDIGDSSKTIDLAPGSTSGVLYDGMSEDGSKVFFTTKDKLLAADTDESADLYQAEVSPEGNLKLQLLSTGTEGAGNSDACDPVANVAGAHWNSLEAEPQLRRGRDRRGWGSGI